MLFVPSVPKTLLYQRYGISSRTLSRRRSLLGHCVSHDPIQKLSLKEVNELEDYWVATNKEWGLSMTAARFERCILQVRDRDPRYSLSSYLQTEYGVTRDEYMRRRGIQPIAELLSSSAALHTIEINAVPV